MRVAFIRSMSSAIVVLAVLAVMAVLAAPGVGRAQTADKPRIACTDAKLASAIRIADCTRYIDQIEADLQRSGDNSDEKLTLLAALFSERATISLENGSFWLQIADLKRMIALRPSAAASIVLGAAYFKVNECKQALAHLAAGIAAGPDDDYVKRYGYMHSAIVKTFCGGNGRADFAASVALDLSNQNGFVPLWLYLFYDDLEAQARLQAATPADWLGKIAAAVLQARAGATVDVEALIAAEPSLAETRRRCEAYFYVGIAEMKSRLPGAADRLTRAVAACPKAYFEFQPARLALAGLGTAAPAP